ncbi:50S ribosomal protein L4 [Bryobacterales bacterium F-183]|nr:50S ribosomal protein L4 [Bryobacterales bacterium F-183]
MPVVDVFNLSNQKVGTVELADAVFGAEINEHLLYEAVRWQMAAQRSGTAATKTRHEVAGSGKKLWRQKGTGRARMGSIRSPLWRHGGTTHGPQPRSYEYRLNKKMVLGALRSALSAKVKDGALAVVSDLSFTDHKTKTMVGVLKALGADRKALFVEVGENTNLQLSARNLQGIKTVVTKDVNVYDVLGAQKVILTKAAAEKLGTALAPAQKAVA